MSTEDAARLGVAQQLLLVSLVALALLLFGVI